MDTKHNREFKAVMALQFTVLIILALACIFAASSNAAPQHKHLVIQCASAEHCETFVISADPRRGELREATANHTVVVETCTLFHGEAQDCTISLTPKGDQIVAWHS